MNETENPRCPRCDAPMVLRRRKRDWSPFWGCSNFANGCRGSRPGPTPPDIAPSEAERRSDLEARVKKLEDDPETVEVETLRHRLFEVEAQVSLLLREKRERDRRRKTEEGSTDLRPMDVVGLSAAVFLFGQGLLLIWRTLTA